MFVQTRFGIYRRTAWCSVSEGGAGFDSAAWSTKENWLHVFVSVSYSPSCKHCCGSPLLEPAAFQKTLNKFWILHSECVSLALLLDGSLTTLQQNNFEK